MIEYDASNDDINKGILGNGLPQMIEKYSKKMNFSDTYTWDVDQHIVSHGILRSGYCSLPSSNKLWNELNLEPRYIGNWYNGILPFAQRGKTRNSLRHNFFSSN